MIIVVIESGFYNDNCYPITTGDEPILVTPVYKSDKAKQYGNEVYNSDLYYYYFKEENVGSDPQAYFESLPKYKAIPFNECFGETEDDVIKKHGAYALIYWGDGTPTEGTVGNYQFPEGYKIGFMVRAKTDFVENGKPRLHPENKKYRDIYPKRLEIQGTALRVISSVFLLPKVSL